MRHVFFASLILVFAGLPAIAEPPAIDCRIVEHSQADKSGAAGKLLEEFNEFSAIEICSLMNSDQLDSAFGLVRAQDISNFRVLELKNLSGRRMRKSLGWKLPQYYSGNSATDFAQYRLCEKTFGCDKLDSASYFSVMNLSRKELAQVLDEWQSVKSRSKLEFDNNAHASPQEIRAFERLKRKLKIEFISSYAQNSETINIQLQLGLPKSDTKWFLALLKTGPTFRLKELTKF